jgi:annexin A7/11
MKGLGTDEDALIKIIANRNPAEIDAIKHAYANKHGKDLIKDVESEISGNFKKVMVGLLQEPHVYDAEVLHRAMAGVGTNEKTLLLFLVGRTNEQMRKIKQAYSHHHSKSLDSAISGEVSGDLKKFMIGLTQDRDPESTPVNEGNARSDAERLYGAGEGKLGTDEATFIEIFTRRSFSHLKKVFAIYETLHKHHTMDKAVESEFSGDLKRGLLGVVTYVRSPGEFWADGLFHAMKGAGTDESTLTHIVVGNRDILSQIKTAFSAKYHKSLWQAVNSETSGDYKKSLLTIIGN